MSNRISVMSASSDTLSAREERFASEYVVDLHGTNAAIRAGYAERSAHVQASRLLKRDKVQARIAELQAQRAKRLEVTVESMLRDLDELCSAAVKAGQFGPAVRAKELAGKLYGMFKDSVLVSDTAKMSDEELFQHAAGGDPEKAAVLRKLLGSPDSFDEPTQH
jgi:hypothetical protein